MAQCNRCGAPLSNTTSRALEVHRLHCPKNAPMEFRPPEHRVPKLASEMAQKYGDEFEVSFCVVIPTFSATNHVNNV